MTRARRVDANQANIVEYLRHLGASVFITSMVGNGFTDLVVGHAGITYLVEVKDGAAVPSRRRLTPDEQRFHDEWRGAPIVVVESVADIVRLLEESDE